MQVLGKELGPAYSITDAWTTAGARNVRAPGARPTCCAGGTWVLCRRNLLSWCHYGLMSTRYIVCVHYIFMAFI